MKIGRILIWALILALALTPMAASAADDLAEAIGGICAYARGASTPQEWLDGALCERIGTAADNYILCLHRMNANLDVSAYVRAAAEAIERGDIANPVSRQRCALALIVCGAADRVPQTLVDDTAGKLGVMSYVCALHLVNNGAPSALWTADSLGEAILPLQRDDGGWAVMGNFGDVDVTAMCLQALACWKSESPARADAIDRALDFLSERQLDSAGFSSMGQENAESAAQVLIALTALGIDPTSDARFLKHGASPLDALMAYRLPSGGFRHLPDDVENETACVQALQALSALMDAELPFYDFSRTSAFTLEMARESARSWKFWALIAIAALTLVCVVVALMRRRGRLKRILFALALAAVAVAAVLLIDVESADSYYAPDAARRAGADGRAFLTIRCDTVAGRADDGSTPESGVILERTEYPFSAGESVFDLLTTAARAQRLHVEHEGGSGDMAYINGINYLYEYDYGELSGWIYSVNGETPSIGCGSYALRDGDEVVWQYSLALGEDLK